MSAAKKKYTSLEANVDKAKGCVTEAEDSVKNRRWLSASGALVFAASTAFITYDIHEEVKKDNPNVELLQAIKSVDLNDYCKKKGTFAAYGGGTLAASFLILATGLGLTHSAKKYRKSVAADLSKAKDNFSEFKEELFDAHDNSDIIPE